MKIQEGIKLRIYPTFEQKTLILKSFGCNRLIYNKTLEFRKSSYENGIKTTLKDINKFLKDLKNNKDYDFLNEVDSTSLQQSQRDLDKAYKNFFEKRSEFPKFHSKHNSNQSYRSESNGHNIFIKEGNFLQIPKLGLVSYRGIIKDKILKINNVTISQNKTGKFYASLCCEIEYTPIENEGCLVGIDVGLKEFYTDSNGNVVHNPKYLEKAEKKLKRLQRKHSKKQKDSKNREKARIKLAKQYEKITNQRNDFLYKEASKLIKENQIICIENLNIKGMLKNHKLAKAISSVSWSKFFSILDYKCKQNGNILIKVDTFYPSSKTCNYCGHINKNLTLEDREWICPQCGEVIKRDENAAKNILNKGKEMYYKSLK